MIITVLKLKDLKQAPWRFSEDLTIGHQEVRDYTSATHNITESLVSHGQLAPIHVRPVTVGGADPVEYEIVDGHVVVDCARKLGWTDISAIVHDLTTEAARLFYIKFNLNRADHYHIKIERVFKDVAGDTETKIETLCKNCSWDEERVRAYVEISERSDNWMKFMYTGDETPKGKRFRKLGVFP